MGDQQQIPGFTPEQAWALRQLIKDAVREANDHDTRVAKLEDCVFGNGQDGLKQTLIQVQAEVTSMAWWYRALAVGVVGSWLTVLGVIITG